jgi:hypothetical protein
MQRKITQLTVSRVGRPHSKAAGLPAHRAFCLQRGCDDRRGRLEADATGAQRARQFDGITPVGLHAFSRLAGDQ